MTDSPAPLFASEGSVYKRRPYVTHEEEDEEHVDASLPSTPIDEDGPWSTPQPSEVPLPPVTDKEESGFRPKVEDVAGARQGVKVEEEEPQLRSIDEADSVGGSSRANDERQCRICFGGLEEEDALGKLISPCLCIGSMRYVHIKCINAWRGTGSNAKAYMECPQCHYQYRLRRTRASGLAQSRAVLIILASLLFIIITTLIGTGLHFLLAVSPSVRETIFTARTPVSDVFEFNKEDDDADYWTAGDSTIIIVGGGGTLMYEIVLGSIQMFTALAIRFAKSQVIFEYLPEPLEDVVFLLGIRFILGLAVLGSFSFLSLLISFSLFGPLQVFSTLRGLGLFRNFIRRRTGDGRGSISQVMMVALVLVGTVNTFFKTYQWIHAFTMRMLAYVETQILEVNPEDRRRAKEQDKRRREQSWLRRWVREGRYRGWRGWWELTLRLALWMRATLRVKWEGFKQRMTQPIDPLDPLEEAVG